MGNKCLSHRCLETNCPFADCLSVDARNFECKPCNLPISHFLPTETGTFETTKEGVVYIFFFFLCSHNIKALYSFLASPSYG